ncbi:MAG: nucleoside recognition domain-containing protein [Halanaerobium sp.]|nr:nucleoside recognition domain-containing protein [Halanaerobium sp.]
MNKIWFGMIVISFLYGSLKGNFAEMSNAVLLGAKDGVDICIKLLGPICLWLGLMKVGEAAGLLRSLQKMLRPLVSRLFPDVPAGHPALGAILLNFSANILGMGNSATPLGIKAMHQLQSLNSNKKEASRAMCTFLVVNTSSITLLPTTIIGLRMAYGSSEPTAIIIPALLATSVSTIVALALDRYYAGRGE